MWDRLSWRISVHPTKPDKVGTLQSLPLNVDGTSEKSCLLCGFSSLLEQPLPQGLVPSQLLPPKKTLGSAARCPREGKPSPKPLLLKLSIFSSSRAGGAQRCLTADLQPRPHCCLLRPPRRASFPTEQLFNLDLSVLFAF